MQISHYFLLYLMNIIQTFWSGNTQQNPLHNRAGWLSPEYNWMSWALSCFQFKKYVNTKHFLENNQA